MPGKGLLAQVGWPVLLPTAILGHGLLRAVPFGTALWEYRRRHIY